MSEMHCARCGKPFKTSTWLSKHFWNIHQKNKDNSNNEGKE